MTNSLPWYRWPIEIDGLPSYKMVDLSMAMLNNQRVYVYIYIIFRFLKVPYGSLWFRFWFLKQIQDDH